MRISVLSRSMANWTVGVAVLLLLVTAVSCRSRRNKSTAGDKTVTSKISGRSDSTRIGFILPLSGDMESYGQDCKKGIEFAAVADSLIEGNSLGNANSAIDEFNKLTLLDSVDFVIGDMFSQTTEAMAPLAKRRGVLLVSPTASSRKISENNIFALSVFPSETYESELIARFAKGKYERVGILYEKVAAAQGMHDAFVELFRKDQVVFDEAFDSSIANFRDIVFKLKRSGCEAVYLVTYTNNAIKLIKQMKGLRLYVDLLGQSALYDPAMYDHLKGYGADFYLTGPLFNMANEDPMSRSFIEGFMAVYGEEPNQMSAQGYIAAIVANDLYQMIKNNEYTEERLLAYRREFFGSEFRFDEHLTSTSGLRMYKYESGSFVPFEQ